MRKPVRLGGGERSVGGDGQMAWYPLWVLLCGQSPSECRDVTDALRDCVFVQRTRRVRWSGVWRKFQAGIMAQTRLGAGNHVWDGSKA